MIDPSSYNYWYILVLTAELCEISTRYSHLNVPELVVTLVRFVDVAFSPNMGRFPTATENSVPGLFRRGNRILPTAMYSSASWRF